MVPASSQPEAADVLWAVLCRSCHRWLPDPFFTVRKNQYGHCIQCLRHRQAAKSYQNGVTKKGDSTKPRTKILISRWMYRPYRYDGKKECTACHKIKERTEFSPRGEHYVAAECRVCHKARMQLVRSR